jgi:hypothetical protein
VKPSDILDQADDPRFIEGIYNYCDRWCERCSFTTRCMLYAMEEEDRDDPVDRDINSEAFWEKMTSIFKQTHEMIATMAAEQGIDLESLDLERETAEEDRLRKKSEDNPLAQSAERYVKMVNQWFDQEFPMSERERDPEPTQDELPLADFDAHDRAASIQDAIEVIRWYQFQIAVKIIRALRHDGLDEEDEEFESEEDVQRDSDGSAKVALIGMERSISAWSRLSELVPTKSGGILPMMVLLEQLRRGAEQKFPRARSFVRPGFDEAPDRFVS